LKINKKYIFILLFIFYIINNIMSEYVPQPIILIHGRGMKDGNNWESIMPQGTNKFFIINLGDYDFRIKKTDNNIDVGRYFEENEYKIPTYYRAFSGEGFDWLKNWGDELKQWVDDFKNAYENRPEHPDFTKFRLISYSAGGLASRWYLANETNPPIERLITLNTPHCGSYIGGMAFIVHDAAIFSTTLAIAYAILSTIVPPPFNANFSKDAVMFATFAASLWPIDLGFYIIGLQPPSWIIDGIDIDMFPFSFTFWPSLKEREEKNKHKDIKYALTYSDKGLINMNFDQFVAIMYALYGLTDIKLFQREDDFKTFFETNGQIYLNNLGQIIATPDRKIALVYGILTMLTIADGDLASSLSSQKGRPAILENILTNGFYPYKEEGYKTISMEIDSDHLAATKRVDIMLKLLDDPSSLAVENSNTLTAVKMEPDGAYINIQHPIIHIDGSCDDYLIQWMGDNDRVRLRYDKYANVDEVVHLKNTEEGIFDYQRVGDVGRGWFLQDKDKRKGV